MDVSMPWGSDRCSLFHPTFSTSRDQVSACGAHRRLSAVASQPDSLGMYLMVHSRTRVWIEMRIDDAHTVVICA